MRVDILRFPPLKSLLRSRWPQFLVTLAALGGFLLAIAAGLFGTPVGSRNFGIVFVWIFWWALLMLVAVPLLGRGWCSICPIPAPGEWLQRGALLAPLGKGLSLGRRWPNRLRNIWLQNGTFALTALFSAVILTQPRASAIVLAAFLFIAVAVSLIYERRAFCRYLCPVGGFIGLYAQLAPLELRVKDAAMCAADTEKTCYTGSAAGYGCPWQVFPPGLVKNTYCGTCMECLRTCPHDNIVINVRAPGADLFAPRGRRLDEAFKALLMLGTAVLYSAVLLGPWGALKSAAYAAGTPGWLTYAAAFVLILFGLLPGLFWLCVWLGRRMSMGWDRSRAPIEDMRALFIRFAYALVPLGLAAWVAFSLSFVFANFSYVWAALSDPFGWGWDLLGTAGIAWTPYLTGIVPSLQALTLLGGLAAAALTAQRLADEGVRRGSHVPGRARLQAMPVSLFCGAITLLLLGLLAA